MREARERANLTQERFGFRAGLHPTYISQLERGLGNPSLDVLTRIAKALHLSLSDLVRSAEEKGH